MFQRILVPLDGSKRAEQAIPVAAKIARASHGSIVLLRAITALINFAGYSMESSIMAEDVIEADTVKAKNYLTRIASSADLTGIPTTIEVPLGDAAATILPAANTQKADLIVMCSHGDTGFKRWILGSVAQKIARHSTIPVLILHEHAGVPTALHPDGARPIQVMVSLDGSPLAEHVLLPAAYLSAALSAPSHGALHLVQVLRFHEIEAYSENKTIAEVREQVIEDTKTYLLSIEQRLLEGETANLQLAVTSSIILERDVAETLISIAENGEEEGQTEGQAEGQTEGFTGCDILAMATHGRGGPQRWVMGSVTERVLSSTRLPMLIVRPHMVTEKQAKAATPASKGEQTVTELEAQSWVGLF